MVEPTLVKLPRFRLPLFESGDGDGDAESNESNDTLICGDGDRVTTTGLRVLGLLTAAAAAATPLRSMVSDFLEERFLRVRGGEDDVCVCARRTGEIGPTTPGFVGTLSTGSKPVQYDDMCSSAV